MDIPIIGVVGAGTMGSGIAQTAAQAGVEVRLADVSPEIVGQAVAAIAKRLQREVDKERMTPEERDAALDRLKPVTDCSEWAEVPLVIEAVTEDLAVKQAVFRRLDEACDATTILATNTSALSVTQIAAATDRPPQVVGIHFFNPAPRMPLIEIVRGLATSEETLAVAEQFAKQLGKTPVHVQDTPGFIVNRILFPMINEAIFALQEGVASAEAIDEALKLGAAHPMGPLALADFVGLDICLAIMETLAEEFGDPKYRPCHLLRQMVRAGRLGRKTGQGFFSYGE